MAQAQPKTSTYAEWVEQRMQRFVDKYDTDPASLAKTALQSGAKNTRELLRQSQHQARFRLPMEKELSDHMACKDAALQGHLTAKDMKSSVPAGRVACWMPQVILPVARRASSKMEDGSGRVKQVATVASPLEFFAATDVPKIENEQGYRDAVQQKAPPCAEWEKLKESMVQDVLITTWLASTRKLEQRTLPEEIFKKIGSYLDPIGDVLLSATYLADVTTKARLSDAHAVRGELLDKSITVLAEASSKQGTLSVVPTVSGGLEACSIKMQFHFPSARSSLTVENHAAWGTRHDDKLFTGLTWDRVGAYEMQKKRNLPARDVLSWRVARYYVQSFFMTSHVLRTYYVGFHGLGFEVGETRSNVIEKYVMTDFKVLWED
eukprot:g2493.t1